MSTIKFSRTAGGIKLSIDGGTPFYITGDREIATSLSSDGNYVVIRWDGFDHPFNISNSFDIGDIIVTGNQTAIKSTIDTFLQGNSIYAGYGLVMAEQFGAQGDLKVVTDASITSGSSVINSATALFTNSDIGKVIFIEGADVAAATLQSTIISYQSPTQVTIAINSSASGSSKQISWGTNDSLALQASIDFATTNSKDLQLDAKSYLSLSELIISGPLRIIGKGCANTANRGRSRIVVNSTSQSAMKANQTGINQFDFSAFNFSIENISTVTPTTGYGLYMGNANNSSLFRISTINFFNNIEVAGGNYYKIDDCKFYDFVNYGLKISNTISPDTGDMAVTRSEFSPVYFSTRPPLTAVKWFSGGGFRFINNKINYQGVSASKMSYGLDFDIGQSVNTSVISILDNSIENCTIYGVYFHSSFTSNSIGKIIIEANEIAIIGNTAVRLDMPSASTAAAKILQSAVITGNYLGGVRGLYVAHTNNVHIGPNVYDVSVACVQQTDNFNLSYEPGTLIPQTNASGIFLWNDLDPSSYTAKSIGSSQIFNYTLDLPQGATNVTTQKLWSIGGQSNRGYRLELEVAGTIEGTGNFYFKHSRYVTSSGTATVSTIGTDETSNATIVQVFYSVASNKVTILMNKTSSGGTILHGVCRLRVFGEGIASIIQEQN